MSSLWTPEGERRVPRQPSGPDHSAGPDEIGEDDEAALAAHLDELRSRLVATPVEIVVANHAYGLFELAAIHLSQQPPDLEQATVAVDALGALVEGLQGRLGEAEGSLVDALAQIRLAFVQIQAAAGTAGDGSVIPEPPAGSAG